MINKVNDLNQLRKVCYNLSSYNSMPNNDKRRLTNVCNNIL